MLPCPQCKQDQAQIQQHEDTNNKAKIVYYHHCQFTCWLKHYHQELKK